MGFNTSRFKGIYNAPNIFNFVIASDFDFSLHKLKIIENSSINDESMNEKEEFPKLIS